MPREKKKKPSEIACRNCALTWAQGCERSDWSWIDPNHIGMTDCARCGFTVCHHCYARSDESWGALCPACWDLPPAASADIAVHPLSVTHSSDYAASVIRNADWRYAAPAGQHCAINPVEVWFWQTYGSSVEDEPRSKEERKRRDHRFSVAQGHAPPLASDDAWLPRGARAFLAALAASDANGPPLSVTFCAGHEQLELAFA